MNVLKILKYKVYICNSLRKNYIKMPNRPIHCPNFIVYHIILFKLSCLNLHEIRLNKELAEHNQTKWLSFCV